MMGLQLIFVVETNKKCKSDWIYIKDTIEHFYQYDHAHTKFSTIYMDGKGNYKNTKTEKEIKNLISQYASVSKSNTSRVLFCFDCDDYDSNQDDKHFLANAQQYCNKHKYHFTWFCKDIERVYINKKVEDSQKKKEAETFKKKKLITNINSDKLAADNFRLNTSNILHILDNYLPRK